MKNLLLSFSLLLSLVAIAQKPRLITPIGHPQGVNDAALSPDGKYLLTGSGGMLIGTKGIVKLWDAQGRELATYPAHESTVNAIAFSPDGGQFISGGGDQTAKLWNLQGQELRAFNHRDLVYAVAFSPDGKIILTAGSENIKLWTPEGQLIRTIKSPENDLVRSTTLSPDGQHILISYDFSSKLLDIKGQVLQNLKGSLPAFSADGLSIFTYHLEEGEEEYKILRFDLQGQELGDFKVPTNDFGFISFLCPSPDGKKNRHRE